MARLRCDVTLKHRANLGEEPVDHLFAEGDPVTILKEWEEHLLCRDEAGRLFNVPKELVDPE